MRVIGNNAVHPGQIDLRDDRATALSLFTFVNLIVDRMISGPKRIEEAYKGLPESAREAIERRDLELNHVCGLTRQDREAKRYDYSKPPL